MWRYFGVVLFFLASSLLGGCSGTQLTIHPNSTENADAVKANPVLVAHNLIDETNAAIAAVGQSVAEDYNAKALTAAEANEYSQYLVKASTYIDTASALLGNGDVAGANSNISFANSLVSLVQTALVKLEQQENK